MNCFYRGKRCIGQAMSKRPASQLVFIFVMLLLIVLVVVGFSFINWKHDYWKIVGSFFSPVPMYEPGAKHILKFVFYLLGTILISGVVFAIFTNFIRTTGERYVNGTASYRLRNHVLFLGFDPLMIGTLRNELNDKGNDFVVAVPDHVASDRPPILLTDEERERLAVAEHNRWNTEKLLNGWEPAAPGKGKTTFRHDKIVSCDKLDEETKAKDIEQIDAVVREENRLGKVAQKPKPV